MKNWEKKFRQHKRNAKRRGIESTITLSEYIQMAKAAGISSPDQIGKHKNSYQLGRIGDIGPYSSSNCRFILRTKNVEEWILNGGCEEVAKKLRGRTKLNHAAPASVSNSRSKCFRIKSPDGSIYEGKNLKEFCKHFNLNRGNMATLLSGKYSQLMGWTGEYIEANYKNGEFIKMN